MKKNSQYLLVNCSKSQKPNNSRFVLLNLLWRLLFTFCSLASSVVVKTSCDKTETRPQLLQDQDYAEFRSRDQDRGLEDYKTACWLAYTQVDRTCLRYYGCAWCDLEYIEAGQLVTFTRCVRWQGTSAPAVFTLYRRPTRCQPVGSTCVWSRSLLLRKSLSKLRR